LIEYILRKIRWRKKYWIRVGISAAFAKMATIDKESGTNSVWT
jgi:hypothetical protein